MTAVSIGPGRVGRVIASWMRPCPFADIGRGIAAVMLRLTAPGPGTRAAPRTVLIPPVYAGWSSRPVRWDVIAGAKEGRR